MEHDARIFIAGGDTLIGRALLDRLRSSGYFRLVNDVAGEVDCTCPGLLTELFEETQPQYVFLAAGASGGIRANQERPAELMRDNLIVATHLIDLAHRHRVRKLLYLASSCIYPKHAPQPLTVDSLMTGRLEPTNEAYATAKLAGLKLCEAYRRQYGVSFITAIPANPFGLYDDFSPKNGHVIPALMRRMHLAKNGGESTVTIWGTGKPRRDFIFSADLADACVYIMNHYDAAKPINIGCQRENTIAEVAHLIADVIGYTGQLIFDHHQPDGMPRKTLDAHELCKLGWQPTTDLRKALEETYDWFLAYADMEETANVRAPL